MADSRHLPELEEYVQRYWNISSQYHKRPTKVSSINMGKALRTLTILMLGRPTLKLPHLAAKLRYTLIVGDDETDAASQGRST